MKIKLATLLPAENALLTLMQSRIKRDSAFAIRHNLRLIGDALTPYNDFRVDLIKTKYGEKQEDGSTSVLPGSLAWAKFQKELVEFIGENELELDLKKIRPEQLPDEFVGAILLDLEWMIDEPAPRKDSRKRHRPALGQE